MKGEWNISVCRPSCLDSTHYAVPSHDAMLVALNDEDMGPSKVATV